MKRFNISALLGSWLSGVLLVAFAFAGCQNQQELVFGESDNGRALDLLENFEKTLLANPNGWQMTYKVPKSSVGGAFTFQLQFSENKTVKIWSDFLDAPTTSSYALSLYNGPMISFDSPGALTKLADPSVQPTPDKKKGDGYWGENDFTIKSVSAEKIVLRGLKYNEDVELLPLSAPANLTNGGVATMLRTFAKQLTMFGDSRALMNGEEELGDVEFDIPDLGAFISSTSELPVFKMSVQSVTQEKPIEYVITPTASGFTVEPAVVVEGKEYKAFVFDEAQKRFTAKDNADVFINLETMSQLAMNLLKPGGKYYGKMLYAVEMSKQLADDIISKMGTVVPNFLAVQLYNRVTFPDGGVANAFTFFAFDEAAGKKNWLDYGGQFELLDDANAKYVFKSNYKVSKPLADAILKEGGSPAKEFFSFFTDLTYSDAFVYIEEVAEDQIKITSFVSDYPQLGKNYWITLKLAN